jgi:hypothetical protein
MNAVFGLRVFTVAAITVFSGNLSSCKQGWFHRKVVVHANWSPASPSDEQPGLDRVQLSFAGYPGTEVEVFGQQLRSKLERMNQPTVDVTFDVWGPDDQTCTGFNVVAFSGMVVPKLTGGAFRVTWYNNKQPRDFCDLLSNR